jgi:amino acid transporter
MMSQSKSIIPAAQAEERSTVAVEKTASTENASDQSSQDAEKHGVRKAPELKRKLKSRHLQMIAIGMLVSV